MKMETMRKSDSPRKAARLSVSAAQSAACAAVLTALLCLALYQWDNKYTAPGSQPINGMLCLTEEDLADVPVRYLIREWEFYPGVLLTPEDLELGGQDYYRRYVSIGQYGGMELDQPSASPRGCGTYRLVLSLPESYLTYSLKMPVVYSAYRLYIGDDLFLQVGDPDPEHYEEALQERVVSFRGRGFVQILIAVSDQGSFYSGMVYPPALGLPLSVSQKEAARQILFTAVELLALAVLVLSIYLVFRSQQGVDIWLIPLCLFLMGYLAYTLSRLFLALPNYPWRFLTSLCLYGFYMMLIWVYSGYYHWRDRWALGMKLAACVILAGGVALSVLVPFCNQARELYLLSSLSDLLRWGLIANTACLTWRTIRENGPHGALLAAGAAALCVSLLASHLLPFYEPILSGWYPEVGMMLFLGVLGLIKLDKLSAAYRFRLTYDERVRQTERLLVLEQAHYAGLQDRIAQTRQARHDLRQHLRTIQLMLQRGELDELSRYVAQYEQSERAVLERPFQFCQLHAVDAILSHYWERTRRLGASFEFTGQLPELPAHMSVDLCALLGNLLENALEAIDKQASGERFLRVSAQVVQGKLLFQVVNSCSSSPRRERDRFYSSKREELGIGTLSVQMIAQRYGGYASFSSEESVFTARAFLPLCAPAEQESPGP